MIAPKGKMILTNRCLGAKTALFLWPLVLYTLIQIATDIIQDDSLLSPPSSLSSPRATLLRDNTNNYYDASCNRHSKRKELASSSHDPFEIHHHQGEEMRSTSPNKKPCSSELKISFPQSSSSSLTSFEALQAKPSSSLLSKAAYYHNHMYNYLSSSLEQTFNSIRRRSIFGGAILMVEASSLYEPNHDKEIIVLNSTNFNTELIQHKHQFPHIKLIEYYVSYCGFCAKFKHTYIKLAKEIYAWRNVIRPSAIDLGVSSNSPIAHSWSVEVVPTLRIHPPPNPSLAEKLDKQLSSWNGKLSSSELQKSMINEYNSSSLMIKSLDVGHYLDKVNLLKSDLLNYIEHYVLKNPTQLPVTWPNLRPVAESSLLELRRNHPRQELFLLIEGGPRTPSPATSSTSALTTTSSAAGSDSDDQSSSGDPSLALSIMMELSSSAPWKAIRYVRASENKALIEDVIMQQKRISEQQQQQQQNQLQDLDNSIVEQVELLNNLITNQNLEGGNNNILLVHIDDSHTSLSVKNGGQLSSAFPSMTIVTGADLATLEQSVLIEQHGGYVASRAKREATVPKRGAKRDTRSLFDSKASSLSRMSRERKIELLTLYINQTYSGTKEDRDFVQAINNLNNDNSKEMQPLAPQRDETSQESIKQNLSRTGGENYQDSEHNTLDTNSQESQQQSLLTKIYHLFNPPERKQNSHLQSSSSTNSFPSDYDDKLKAIRYMLFNEIPRTTIIDKSLNEQQEKLNTLVNLVTVIKAYFPLPDASSIQFIDGVQNYLIKQQQRLSSISQSGSGNQERGIITNFDTRAFKQELKRLESEDKRLPEIKEWKHCKSSGYPCGVWRLFHTLVAFEYKKLSQMRQSSSSPSSQPLSRIPSTTPSLHQLDDNNSNLSPSLEPAAVTMKSVANLNGVGSSSSPVERLVSPPSTTTSLSLTIATPPRATPDNGGNSNNNNSNNSHNNNKLMPLTEADLPTPVLLVMRDYITTFFICEECRRKFRSETAELSFEKIRQQEPAEFSILWLWETHNRVNKRLSVDQETSPRDHPKVWFPTYQQCSTCYKKPPSFLQDPNVDPVTIFHESIVWNKQEILCYLVREYTRQPMDNQANIFGYQVPFGFGYIIVTCISCLVLVVVFRCTSYYIERQRRHKATLLNGNGAHYHLELQVPN